MALPLNWLIIPPAPPLLAPAPGSGDAPAPEPPRGAMPILAFYFCATAFVTGAMAAHLPRFLESAGASEAAAIAAGALVGPAQVAARLVEFGLLRAVHPVWSARIAAVMHPLGAAVLGALGPAGVALFALLHGAGNGMITIARGTLPLAIFGPAGYGLRTGILAAAVAGGAVGGAVCVRRAARLDRHCAVLVSAGLSLAAFASLWLLRPRPPGGRAGGERLIAQPHRMPI